MRNNTRKFLREASEPDIRIFESVAGGVLDALGYERAYVKRGEELSFAESDIAAFDRENARLKEETRGLVDPADLMRRDLQANLLKDIKARHSSRGHKATGVPGEPTQRRELDA
jgi:hypothetical protein